jgi:hypothetical protein
MNTVINGLARIGTLREELKKETRDFRESLPAMPAHIFATLVSRTVSQAIEQLGKDHELHNWQDKYRLLSSQKEQLAAARADHTAQINAPERKAQIVASVGEATFKTFKMTMTKAGVMKFSLTGTLKV